MGELGTAKLPGACAAGRLAFWGVHAVTNIADTVDIADMANATDACMQTNEWNKLPRTRGVGQAGRWAGSRRAITVQGATVW